MADKKFYTDVIIDGILEASGLSYPATDGNSGDYISTDGAGNLGFQAFQEGFSVFPIWAEENGALSNNNRQWSFGNGSTGNIGITVPDCQIFSMSLDAEVGGTSVSIEIMVDDIAVASILFTGAADYVTLSTPIVLTEGQVLGFRTDVETGAYTDVRVTAWCRIPFQGIKGEPGADGQDGADSAPNTFARVVCGTTAQVNAATYTTLNLNSTPTLDTIGITVGGNQITVPPGTYEVKGVFNIFSADPRPNQEVRMLVGGVEYSAEYGEGYIRDSSGHNEAKINYTDIFTTGVSTDISFQMRQLSAAGTVSIVTLPPNVSKILLHRIA